MELWFTENQKDSLRLSCRVKKVLARKRSAYQEIGVLDTEIYGTTLILDGYIQVTQLDECIYHEMIVHVPLVTHGYAGQVLVIGGGDGGSVREVLKHSSVKEVVLVEIDEEVVEICRRHFPGISASLEDERVTVLYEDGFEYLKQCKNEFDVIIVDSTEPVGPSKGLFCRDLYLRAERALQEKGILVAQTESPFFNRDLLKKSYEYVKEFFPTTCLYLAPVPSYPGGLWSFSLGSKGRHPLDISLKESSFPFNKCRYYSPEVHVSSFTLPPLLKNILEDQ